MPGFGDTYALNMAIDGLFHFTRWERLDPYLALGGGFTLYGDDINGETFDPVTARRSRRHVPLQR